MKSAIYKFIIKSHNFFLGLGDNLNFYIDGFVNKKYFNYPYGNKPHTTKEKYLEIWDKAKSISFPEIDRLEKQFGYAASKEWIDELALLTQVVIKGSEINYQHGRVLYSVLSSYIKKNPNINLNILETGTARGFSSICMSKSISDMDSYGAIISFDIIPNNQSMFWGCISDLDGPKTRLELLKNYKNLLTRITYIQGDTRIQVKKHSTSRVNFAFIDGGHKYEDVLNDFNFISGRQEKGDIVIFDDYTQSKFSGIVRAVDEICQKYKYSSQVVLLGTDRGYCIATKK